MNGNSEVSADPVTDDAIRRAISRTAARAAERDQPGFTELAVTGTLSKGTVGLRPVILSQVHDVIKTMVRAGDLVRVEDVPHSVVLDYFIVPAVAVTA